MSKYLDPLVKMLIILTAFLSLMRVRYIWQISKLRNEENKLIIRDREGDSAIIIIFLLVINSSIFDKFKYSYQPILRHLHAIIIVMFLIYSIMQFTQILILVDRKLYTPQDVVDIGEIKKCKIKKHLISYRISLHYTKGKKDKKLSLITSNKKRQLLEEVFEELNVNIV
ncbi:MAG: hypothetical protein GX366_07915 [Epulopiscium sp.]|nr:hypothetical protein [Candidatus Epulonipiscium sp.]